MDMPDGKKGDDEEKRCCRGADAGEPLAALPLLVVVRHLHHGAQRLIFRRVLFFFHSLLLFLCRRGAPEERGCRQTQSRGQRLQKRDVGVGKSTFPFAHGLIGDVEHLGQLLLSQVPAAAIFSDKGAENLFVQSDHLAVIVANVPENATDRWFSLPIFRIFRRVAGKNRQGLREGKNRGIIHLIHFARRAKTDIEV